MMKRVVCNVTILLCVFAQILVASDASSPNPSGIFSSVAQWGLAGTIIVFTLWRDWHREQNLQSILTERDEYIRCEMQRHISESSEVSRRMVDAARHMEVTAKLCHEQTVRRAKGKE
jgi:hypothetical protein